MSLKLWIVAGISLLVLVGGFFLTRLILLAFESRDPKRFPDPPSFSRLNEGEGELIPCPKTPNCYIVTIPRDELTLTTVQEAVISIGGEVIQSTENYLYAIFHTRIFGYVDDFEMAVRGESIQIRSASRVGYSDMGTNQKRVETLLSHLGVDNPL